MVVVLRMFLISKSKLVKPLVVIRPFYKEIEMTDETRTFRSGKFESEVRPHGRILKKSYGGRGCLIFCLPKGLTEAELPALSLLFQLLYGQRSPRMTLYNLHRNVLVCDLNELDFLNGFSANSRS